MGLFGWIYDTFLMSDAERQRKASVEAYQRDMQAHWATYRPKLEEARRRWGETQKELYRTYGIHFATNEENGEENISAEEQDEYENIKEDLRQNQQTISGAIKGYKTITTEAKRYFSNPN